MTLVEAHYDLQAPLTKKQMRQLALLTATYGIRRLRLEKDGARLLVEYDASRYVRSEITQLLHLAGLPVVEPEGRS